MTTATATATVAQGTMLGTETGGVVRFAGIPFASSVSGTRRFHRAEPHPGWSGTRDATAFGPVAPQIDFMATMFGNEPEPTDEDCLYLNVYTPGVDDHRRPVMVWIHGGAFVLGSGSAPGYDGSALARRGDVVVVTINYRLGALGFLHLAGLDPTYPASGNLGILDQILALEWVRDNIAVLGGDPGNVTIFGESAGGMSVGTLLGTPAAKGLFHRAIPQSGAAGNVSPVGHAEEVTEKFLAASGAADLAALARLPVGELLAVQQAFTMGFFTDVDGQIGAGADLRLPFQPVIDGEVLATGALDNIAAGSAAGVPVLIGTNRDEWNLFAFLDTADVDDALLEARFNKVFGDGRAAVEVYRDALPGAPAKSLFGAAVTDLVFRQPAVRLAEALMANGSPVFSYLFTWASPAMGGLLGSCHALEVPFVFGDLEASGLAMLVGDHPPMGVVDAMQESWLAFARSGDPSNDVVGEWSAYDTERRATMMLDVETGVVDDPEGSRRELWRTIA